MVAGKSALLTSFTEGLAGPVDRQVIFLEDSEKVRKQLKKMLSDERGCLLIIDGYYPEASRRSLINLISKFKQYRHVMATDRNVLSPMAKGKSVKILMPPGFRLARLAEFVYSKKTYQEIFEPILSDLRIEYQEALEEKRWHKARWIAFCGRWHFVAAALARIPVSLTRLVITLWKISGS